MKCTKAIIPVAGYGSRRLPITKAIDKYMMPILNRPIIDYVIQDCIAAGVVDFYVVVSKGGGKQLLDYYGRNEGIEAYLNDHNKQDLLPLVAPLRSDVKIHLVEQDTEDGRYGTTIPVWLCSEFVQEGEQVLVCMGDNAVYNFEQRSEAARLVEAAAHGGSAMLGVEVPSDELHRWGVIGMKENDKGQKVFDYIHEKPKDGEAPSNLINVSNYIFDRAFFDMLDASVAAGPNESGEYFITDPINDYVKAGHYMGVVESDGKFLDSGTLENWLFANNYIAEHNRNS